MPSGPVTSIAPVSGSTPTASATIRPAAPSTSTWCPVVRWRCRPAARIEPARHGAPRSGARAAPASIEQRVPVDGPATRQLPEAGHRGRQLRGEARAGQSALTPDAHDRARDPVPVDGRLAQHPGDLAQQAVRTVRHDVVGPLEPQRAVTQACHILGCVEHRQGHGRSQPPGMTGRQPDAAGTRPRRGAPRPDGADHVRPRRPRPRSAHRRPRPPTSASPASSQPRTTRLGRGDAREALESRDEAVTARPPRRWRRPTRSYPARAAGSSRLGLLQLEGRVERRAASSTWSSAMMQVMRISEVEIISMLTPASASAPNIRAA